MRRPSINAGMVDANEFDLDDEGEGGGLMDDLLNEILMGSYEVEFPRSGRLGIKFLPNLAILDQGWEGDSSAIVESVNNVTAALNGEQIKPGHLLLSVNGMDTLSQGYEKTLALLRDASLAGPTTLKFHPMQCDAGELQKLQLSIKQKTLCRHNSMQVHSSPALHNRGRSYSWVSPPPRRSPLSKRGSAGSWTAEDFDASGNSRKLARTNTMRERSSTMHDMIRAVSPHMESPETVSHTIPKSTEIIQHRNI